MSFNLWTEIEDIVLLLEHGASDESVTTKSQNDSTANNVLHLVDLAKHRNVPEVSGLDPKVPLENRLQNIIHTLGLETSPNVVDSYTTPTETLGIASPKRPSHPENDASKVASGESAVPVETHPESRRERTSTEETHEKGSNTSEALYERPVVVRGFLTHHSNFETGKHNQADLDPTLTSTAGNDKPQHESGTIGTRDMNESHSRAFVEQNSESTPSRESERAKEVVAHFPVGFSAGLFEVETKPSDPGLLSAWETSVARQAVHRMAQADFHQEHGPSSETAGFSESIAEAYRKNRRDVVGISTETPSEGNSLTETIAQAYRRLHPTVQESTTQQSEQPALPSTMTVRGAVSDYAQEVSPTCSDDHLHPQSQEHGGEDLHEHVSDTSAPVATSASDAMVDESVLTNPKPDMTILSRGTDPSRISDPRQVDEIKYRYVIGKRSGKDIFDRKGNVIIGKYQVITEQAIDLTEREGKLVELIVNMVIEGYGD